MARKIGVLEAHQSLTDQPVRKVKLSVANYLVRQLLARRISRSLIQMLKVRAQDAIREIRAWWDGVLGTGNALPFSRPTDPSHKHHYEIPRAGDIGLWRHERKKLHHCQGCPACRPLVVPAAG